MHKNIPLTCTILGCGTSVGVPSLGRLGWGACDPEEPRNRRQRCAILLQSETTNLLVDAGPDIRNQLLPHQLEKLDGVIITHTHSDHIAGLDDLRVFFFPDRVELPIFATEQHGRDIIERFPYMFTKKPESPTYFIPPLIHHEVQIGDSITVGDITVDILFQEHGQTFSLGLIFNDKIGYSTDVKTMPTENFDKLSGIPYWIVESLRDEPHQAHVHFDETMRWIERVQPQQAYLTHLGLEADYQKTLSRCPEHVEPAYDGLVFKV